jgi:Spy/CpxP family protein refolding chaperone
MKTKDAPIRRRKSRVTISALTVTLLSVVCVVVLCAETVSSQNLRRRMRIQRKIDKKTPRPAGNPNKLTPSNSEKEDPDISDQPGTTAPRITTQGGGHSLEGIRQRGAPSFFTEDEASLWIPGFGNRAALLMILRQLDLTPEQKAKIRDLRRQVGNRLRLSRQELNQLELQLEEAIYGNLDDPASLDNYDPAKVKELTEQVVTKRAEWFKLQTDIESQFRQILTPDQFYVYRELILVREMALPGRRNPAARRQQRRNGIQPNQQNRPDRQDQPDGD